MDGSIRQGDRYTDGAGLVFYVAGQYSFLEDPEMAQEGTSILDLVIYSPEPIRFAVGEKGGLVAVKNARPKTPGTDEIWLLNTKNMQIIDSTDDGAGEIFIRWMAQPAKFYGMHPDIFMEQAQNDH